MGAAALAQKFIEIGASKQGEDDNVKHTIAYGLGLFGYLVQK